MASDFVIPAATNVLREARENSPLLGFREPTGNPMLYRQVAANARTIGAYQTALQQLNARISRCERRAGIIEDNTQGVVAMPFSIYQPALATGAVSVTNTAGAYTLNQIVVVSGGTVAPGGNPSQITVDLVDASGNLLACHISTIGAYTDPPPANTGLASGDATITILGAGDAWRMVAIRSGMVGARCQWPPLTTGGGGKYPYVDLIDSNYGYVWGNGDWVFGLDLDGNLFSQFDYAGATGNTVVTLPVGNTPKLIYGRLADGTKISYGQIALDGLVGGGQGGEGQAAFWIEIVDDTTKGFYVNVWGQMLEYEVTPPTPFPTGPNIIPIGYILASLPAYGNPVGIGQLISGDLTSRYPAMNLSNGLGLPQVQRGYWNANALTGQFFYNGDTVIDDSLTLGFWVSLTSGGAATTQVLYHPVWQYIGGYSVQNSSPSVANGWQTLGAVIAY